MPTLSSAPASGSVRGPEAIHVVDLDGAEKGRPVQLDLIAVSRAPLASRCRWGAASAPSKTCAPCGVPARAAS